MFRRKPKTIAAHPVEILWTEFMGPMGITALQFAKALHFPGIYEVVRDSVIQEPFALEVSWR